MSPFPEPHPWHNEISSLIAHGWTPPVNQWVFLTEEVRDLLGIEFFMAIVRERGEPDSDSAHLVCLNDRVCCYASGEPAEDDGYEVVSVAPDPSLSYENSELRRYMAGPTEGAGGLRNGGESE